VNIDDALDIADDGIYDDPAEIDRALLALAAEVRQLRARDEAAAAVVRAVEENPIPRTVWTETPLGSALDALARMYADGGREG
jgi:hypothetical protein